MDAIERYVTVKREYLNLPAEAGDLEILLQQLPAMSELKYIYSYFDGDRCLDDKDLFNYQTLVPHPFLSGMSSISVSGLLEDMNHIGSVWDMVEDDLDIEENTYPLRYFYPFISTGMGRGIGPIYAKNSKFNEAVIEYDYEAGEFRVWSKNLKSFIEAFFNFSVDRYVPTNVFEKDEAEYIFTDEDKAYLSKWPDIVYPVMGEEFISDQELL